MPKYVQLQTDYVRQLTCKDIENINMASIHICEHQEYSYQQWWMIWWSISKKFMIFIDNSSLIIVLWRGFVFTDFIYT